MHIIKERVAKTVPNRKTAVHTGLYDSTQLKNNGEIFNTEKYVVYTCRPAQLTACEVNPPAKSMV